MRKTTKAQNLTRLEESLTGDEIEALNNLTPGLGSKIHRLIANLGNLLAAQAGWAGTVTIAEQQKKDTRGRPMPAMQFQEQRLADVADPIDDLDVVNLRTLRKWMDCDNLTEILRDCPEAAEVIHAVEPPPSEPPVGGGAEAACEPAELTLVSETELPEAATPTLSEYPPCRAVGDFLYVLGGFGEEFHIYFIRDPSNPVRLSSLNLSDNISWIEVQGHYAYLTGSNAGLLIVDVRDPVNPVEINSGYNPTGVAYYRGSAIQGPYAYLTAVNFAAQGSFQIVDISNPANPALLSDTAYGPAFSQAAGAFIVGDYLYLGDQHLEFLDPDYSFYIYNVADPLSPVLVGSAELPNHSSCHDLWVDGQYVYAMGDIDAFNEGQVAIFDISDPANPTLVGDCLTGNAVVTHPCATQITGQGDHVYCVGGDSNLIQVDVSDRTAPVVSGYSATAPGYGKPDIQSQYVWAVRNSAAVGVNPTLEAYYVGGFYCEEIRTAALLVDGTSTADIVRGRRGIFSGELVGKNLTVDQIGVFGGAQIIWGNGDPNGVQTAVPGSVYLDLGGGAGVTLYVKESGTGDTGWVAK